MRAKNGSEMVINEPRNIEAQSTILPPNLNDNQPPGILVNKRFIIRNILNIRIEFIGFYLS